MAKTFSCIEWEREIKKGERKIKKMMWKIVLKELWFIRENKIYQIIISYEKI